MKTLDMFIKKEFKWLKDISKAIELMNENDYYVFIVSNQSRRWKRVLYRKECEIILHLWINEKLNKGAHIDEFVYSPYWNSKDIVLINIKNLENPKQECWII